MQGKIVPLMRQLKNTSSVDYNDTATIKLDHGVYHVLELETNLAKRTTIKKVTIDIGGRPVVTATGKQLITMEALFKKHKTPGRLYFDLSKFEYRSPRGIYKTALPIGMYDDATLEIEFGSRDESDADNKDPAVLTMKAKAWVSDNPAYAQPDGGRTFEPVRKKITLASEAAEEMEWIYVGGNVNSSIQRLLLDESEVQISKITVWKGETKDAEYYRSDIDSALQRYSDVELQPGFLLFDPTLMGFGEEAALNTAGLKFTLTTSGKGTIPVYVEGFNKLK